MHMMNDTHEINTHMMIDTHIMNHLTTTGLDDWTGYGTIAMYSLHYTYTFRVTQECMWERHNVLLHQA